MAAKHRLLLSLLPIISLVHAQQHVLQQQEIPTAEPQGALRRFHFNGSHAAAEEVIAFAVENNLDVWQSTPSYIDVHTPDVGVPVHLPSTLTPTPPTLKEQSEYKARRRAASTSVGWNLTSLANTSFHGEYHPLHEVDAFVNQLGETFPGLVKVVRLGHSGEGREMVGLTISRGGVESKGGRKKKHGRKGKEGEDGGDDDEEEENEKMGFVITGTQHAREWVATATALYLAHALVADASEEWSLGWLLDYYDFHIIPVPNPDGYDYTWSTDRFWYKNRMVIGPHAKCVGIDMNRNWGYKWSPLSPSSAFSSSNTTSSPSTQDPTTKTNKNRKKPPPGTDPCSHFFPGHRAFEAPEVNNIANFVGGLGALRAFVDLRSYGQMISSPYSYSCKRVAKDAENQLEAAMGAAAATRAVHGAAFSTGTLCSMLYRARGNIVDWMYARMGIEYAYAVHLRDTGTYGFSLPAELIRTVGEETGALVGYLGGFIVKSKK